MKLLDIIIIFAVLHFTWLGYQLVQMVTRELEDEEEQ